jgi:glycosyltransferase involved in cell wall biosynthesis
VLSEEVCFLVDPTPESLAAGIEAVIGDPNRARARAAAARKLYESNYSRTAYEERLRAVLKLMEPPCAA